MLIWCITKHNITFLYRISCFLKLHSLSPLLTFLLPSQLSFLQVNILQISFLLLHSHQLLINHRLALSPTSTRHRTRYKHYRIMLSLLSRISSIFSKQVNRSQTSTKSAQTCGRVAPETRFNFNRLFNAGAESYRYK